jgi:hypothetical protein
MSEMSLLKASVVPKGRTKVISSFNFLDFSSSRLIGVVPTISRRLNFVASHTSADSSIFYN